MNHPQMFTKVDTSLCMIQAKGFRKAFKLPCEQTAYRRNLQTNLILEEFKEFLDAEQTMRLIEPKTREACLKELADLVYVCYQYAANMRWDLDSALDRVHESNMSKLGENGEPLYREDGKVLKGPFYQPPYLLDLI